MKLFAVSVARPREVEIDGERVPTGIYKEPVAGRVMVRGLNVDGDQQADLKHHGGKYQAVYCYPREHYAAWAAELGRDGFPPGQFGENLTVEGLTEDGVYVGDVLRIGGAVLQVTQPRVPCFKLAHKMGLPEFPKRMLANGRVGFYTRVLEEGEIGAGDAIERIAVDPERLSITEVIRFVFFHERPPETAARARRVAALSPEWRRRFGRD